MNRYFVAYPRNFANEYKVYVCESERTERRLLAVRPDAERISRGEAVRLGWTRPREARRNGQEWHGGFAEPLYHSSDPQNVREAIVEAAQGTLDEINETEAKLRESAAKY